MLGSPPKDDHVDKLLQDLIAAVWTLYGGACPATTHLEVVSLTAMT